MRHAFAILVLGASLLVLAGCGSTPPAAINDVCTVFAERSGFFRDWHKDAKRAERKYGIPVNVLMATIRVESGFARNARPPRRKLLGIVPWKRKSTAYGFSQALNGTWAQYRSETGRRAARRSNFAASVDFVGWYHAKTVEKFGVSPHDAYTLYLSYRYGWSGFKGGRWRNDRGAHTSAARTAAFADKYRNQMRGCR